LQPTGRTQVIEVGKCRFTVVEVSPTIAWRQAMSLHDFCIQSFLVCLMCIVVYNQ
jgi:hypothetical protein